ncbi:DJ-1/PfpI family protein [Ureibacillus sp. FSL W8-0352]|uniref:DJ-1/PfpI family protein n=1 Tax=Ureibacillus sp. FSL W8-0352 TaxID=2954596 RepID=UPI0030F7B056
MERFIQLNVDFLRKFLNKNHENPGFCIQEAKAEEFDAVVIPGDSAPEALRINDDIVVKEVYEQGELIVGICHGPQVMISIS